ncbi:NUDIX domain-containing protein [Streptomyces hoynatensis]|nr:NUDIX hydrolase [Streptomyces hoynatensis]
MRPLPAPLPRQPLMSNADYAASRHTVWISASALITDPFGRVLLVEPTYRDTLLLPGGAVEAGEHPAEACRREVAEETGLAIGPERALAIDHVVPGVAELPPDLPFPGDIHIVFDGGTLPSDAVAGLRLPPEELAGARFLPPGEAAAAMTALEARRMLAALRARWGATGPVYLQDGRHLGPPPPLDAHGVLVRPGEGLPRRWHPGAHPPAGPGAAGADGWLIAPDGRVLLLVEDGRPLPALPGGRVRKDEGEDPAGCVTRLAAQRAGAAVEDACPLGFEQPDGGRPDADAPGADAPGADAPGADAPGADAPGAGAVGVGAAAAGGVAAGGAGRGPSGGIGEGERRGAAGVRVHVAARLTGLGPAAAVPGTGRPRVRLLATPEQAAALLGSGPAATAQAREAARVAAARWGIAPAPPTPVAEVPAGGMRW